MSSETTLVKSAQYLSLATGLIFLLAAILAGFHSLDLGWPSLVAWPTMEASSACAGFGTTSAVSLALFQFFRLQRISSSSRRLDAARRGIIQAYEVLQKERPTRQIAWVNAARLVLRSNELARALTEQVHEREWKLFVEEWRVAYLEYLQADYTYFFGTEELKRFPDDLKIERRDLEALASKIADNRTFEIDGYHSSLFADLVLSERSIKVIYEFARLYDQADDPLQSCEPFKEEEIEEVGNYHLNGLFAFLRIRRKYNLDGGEVSEWPKSLETD